MLFHHSFLHKTHLPEISSYPQSGPPDSTMGFLEDTLDSIDGNAAADWEAAQKRKADLNTQVASFQ